MKISKCFVAALLAASFVFGFAACSNSSSDNLSSDDSSSTPAPRKANFVKVEGSTVKGGNQFKDASYNANAGVFIAGRFVEIATFYMSDIPVTQDEYKSVVGSNPSYFNGSSGKEAAAGEMQENRPVENVS